MTAPSPMHGPGQGSTPVAPGSVQSVRDRVQCGLVRAISGQSAPLPRYVKDRIEHGPQPHPRRRHVADQIRILRDDVECAWIRARSVVRQGIALGLSSIHWAANRAEALGAVKAARSLERNLKALRRKAS
jgi:hypothetical protein